MKFKVGDRVVWKRPDPHSFNILKSKGIVIDIENDLIGDTVPVLVRFESGYKKYFTIDGRYYSKGSIQLFKISLDKKIQKIFNI